MAPVTFSDILIALLPTSLLSLPPLPFPLSPFFPSEHLYPAIPLSALSVSSQSLCLGNGSV